MKNKISKNETEEFLKFLEKRFDENSHRHENVEWEAVLLKIEKDENLLSTIYKMEHTGGEPDVFKFENVDLCFVDFAKESPKERRSFCYDDEALHARKKFPPENSAKEFAEEIGIELLTEEEYHEIQKIEKLDTKTSSWLQTPTEMREKGGAIFGDFRFGRVFIYHNGVESYYGGRGFRGKILIK